jgi:hypothetical protein
LAQETFYCQHSFCCAAYLFPHVFIFQQAHYVGFLFGGKKKKTEPVVCVPLLYTFQYLPECLKSFSIKKMLSFQCGVGAVLFNLGVHFCRANVMVLEASHCRQQLSCF